MFKKLSIYAGLIIPAWLALGVFIAGSLNQGYSHIHRAMSELGAVGSATHVLSPLINNFPLGVLFIVFGVAVIRHLKGSKLAVASGILIIVHGLGSLLTGHFSCDPGCRSEFPSTSQTLHNLAGLVMFLSLTFASCIWIFLGKKLLNSSAFSWFSVACTLTGLLAGGMLPLAMESGFGLYQRINYGASVIWLAGLAYVLLRNESHAN